MRLAGIYGLGINVVIRCRIRYRIPAAFAYIMYNLGAARLISQFLPLHSLGLALLVLCRIRFAGLILQIVQCDFHHIVTALVELYKGSAQVGLLPYRRPLPKDVVQIDAVHCDLLCGLLHGVALLSVEGYEYWVSCVVPVELACEEASRLRESYLDTESTFI